MRMGSNLQKRTALRESGDEFFELPLFARHEARGGRDTLYGTRRRVFFMTCSDPLTASSKFPRALAWGIIPLYAIGVGVNGYSLLKYSRDMCGLSATSGHVKVRHLVSTKG